MEKDFRCKELTIGERVKDLLSRLTLDEKIDMLSGHQKAVERLGISEWYIGTEVARGFVSREDGQISTVTPQPVGMASTFDKELMYKLGEIAGKDARYYHHKKPTGKLMLWGPTVDPERNPLWGRNEEAYGEDTCLAGEMTREYTAGMAGSRRSDEPADKPITECTTAENGVLLRTVPTLKHFCANNNEEDRGKDNSNATMQLLHEYYYRAFMPALREGGAHSAMASYNKVAGIPGDMNPDIQKILKDKWGMDFSVSDGGAFSQNVNEHKFVRTHGEALALCIKNGMDSMTDDADIVSAAARDALEKGLITEKDIDLAVGNTLIGRFRLGEFDGDNKYSLEIREPDGKDDRRINLRASLEQVCLLKNSGVLPIKNISGKKILVAGPISDENYRDWYTGTASYAVSVRKAFEDAVGSENVIYDNGWDIVAVRSVKNGKYLSVTEDGTAAFTADNIGDSEKFELHNWDDETFNFRSLSNKKYLTEVNGCYKAVSDTPYDWFIREWFKAKKPGSNYCFESWHDDSIYMDDDEMLHTRHSCRPSEDRLFEIVTLSSGGERLKKLSEDADHAVLCVGNHPMQIARECYDRKTLDLPPHQKELAMSLDGEKLILAIISGYPYAAAEETAHSSAVLYSSHCGAELGNAMLSVISGQYNPAARCPITWYRNDCELPSIKEYNIKSAKCTYLYYDGEPLFPFGFGLSYSEFEYLSMNVSAEEEYLSVTVDVKNISDTDGDEVVQIYYREKNADHNPRLCGFERVNIPAGETAHVSIMIPYERLSRFDAVSGEMRFITDEYTISAAASCKDIRLSKEIKLTGEMPGQICMDMPVFFENCISYYGAELDYSIIENDRFLRFNGWGGMAEFDSPVPDGCRRITIYASAPCGKAEIVLENADEKDSAEIAKIQIPCTPSAESFVKLEMTIPDGTKCSKTRFSVKGTAGLYKFICT